MMPLRWARPCAVLVLLLFAGSRPLRAAPDRPAPVLTVEAAYPGANAQLTAETVAAPLEEQVNGLENVLHLCSQSTQDGRYTLRITLAPGTDLDVAQILVHNRVDLAMPQLPAAVQRAGVTVRKQAPGVLLFVTLFSPDQRYNTLYLANYASLQIKDELARVAGVGDVSLCGGQAFGMHIWLDPDKLAASNLTAADVTRAFEAQQTRGVAGSAGSREALQEAADLILKNSGDGHVVRLKDVARVEMGAASSHAFTQLDGQPAVALAVSATGPQVRPRRVSAAVREVMERLKTAFPEGLDYSLTFDLTTNPDAAYVLLEPSLPEASADRPLPLLERCAKSALQTEGVQHVLTLSENPLGRFREGPCLVVQLARGKDQAGQERLLQKLRRQLDLVEDVKVRLRDLAGTASYPVDLALRGPDADRVREWGEQVMERLERTGKLTDLAATPEAVARQRYVEVDREAARTYGVAVADIFTTLQVYLGEVNVGDLSQYGRIWKVQLKVQTPGSDPAEDIKRLKVRNARGEMVPLSNFVRIREVSGPSSLERLDLMPMAEITANPAQGVSLGQTRSLCETLVEEIRKDRGLSSDYRLVWLQDLPPAEPIPRGEKPAREEPPAPPEVNVSQPLEREITDYEDFTGRTEAVANVEIRARVSGYLIRVLFKDGSDVKRGDLLFEIDPRPYQVQLDQAQSQMILAEASLKLAKAALERDQAMNTRIVNSVSPQQLDQDQAAVDEATARVRASRATIEAAKLNLEFTRVTCPIDGRIGRRFLDPGNLVKADDTLLATVVSQDPIYAYFDMDERTVLRLRRLIEEGKIKSPQEADMPAFLGLADEEGFPRQGKINFVDNQVNAETGTLRVRALFPNPRGLLSPGLFVRIRIPVGAPHKALLVPEEAIGTDQGLKYVYVVNDQNKAEYRRVRLGVLQEGGLRVIEEGLQPGNHVIVSGLRRVRPTLTVRPREIPIPNPDPSPPR